MVKKNRKRRALLPKNKPANSSIPVDGLSSSIAESTTTACQSLGTTGSTTVNSAVNSRQSWTKSQLLPGPVVEACQDTGNASEEESSDDDAQCYGCRSGGTCKGPMWCGHAAHTRHHANSSSEMLPVTVHAATVPDINADSSSKRYALAHVTGRTQSGGREETKKTINEDRARSLRHAKSTASRLNQESMQDLNHGRMPGNTSYYVVMDSNNCFSIVSSLSSGSTRNCSQNHFPMVPLKTIHNVIETQHPPGSGPFGDAYHGTAITAARAQPARIVTTKDRPRLIATQQRSVRSRFGTANCVIHGVKMAETCRITSALPIAYKCTANHQSCGDGQSPAMSNWPPCAGFFTSFGVRDVRLRNVPLQMSFWSLTDTLVSTSIHNERLPGFGTYAASAHGSLVDDMMAENDNPMTHDSNLCLNYLLPGTGFFQRQSIAQSITTVDTGNTTVDALIWILSMVHCPKNSVVNIVPSCFNPSRNMHNAHHRRAISGVVKSACKSSKALMANARDQAGVTNTLMNALGMLVVVGKGIAVDIQHSSAQVRDAVNEDALTLLFSRFQCLVVTPALLAAVLYVPEVCTHRCIDGLKAGPYNQRMRFCQDGPIGAAKADGVLAMIVVENAKHGKQSSYISNLSFGCESPLRLRTITVFPIMMSHPTLRGAVLAHPNCSFNTGHVEREQMHMHGGNGYVEHRFITKHDQAYENLCNRAGLMSQTTLYVLGGPSVKTQGCWDSCNLINALAKLVGVRLATHDEVLQCFKETDQDLSPSMSVPSFDHGYSSKLIQGWMDNYLEQSAVVTIVDDYSSPYFVANPTVTVSSPGRVAQLLPIGMLAECILAASSRSLHACCFSIIGGRSSAVPGFDKSPTLHCNVRGVGKVNGGETMSSFSFSVRTWAGQTDGLIEMYASENGGMIMADIFAVSSPTAMLILLHMFELPSFNHSDAFVTACADLETLAMGTCCMAIAAVNLDNDPLIGTVETLIGSVYYSAIVFGVCNHQVIALRVKTLSLLSSRYSMQCTINPSMVPEVRDLNDAIILGVLAYSKQTKFSSELASLSIANFIIRTCPDGIVFPGFVDDYFSMVMLHVSTLPSVGDGLDCLMALLQTICSVFGFVIKLAYTSHVGGKHMGTTMSIGHMLTIDPQQCILPINGVGQHTDNDQWVPYTITTDSCWSIGHCLVPLSAINSGHTKIGSLINFSPRLADVSMVTNSMVAQEWTKYSAGPMAMSLVLDIASRAQPEWRRSRGQSINYHIRASIGTDGAGRHSHAMPGYLLECMTFNHAGQCMINIAGQVAHDPIASAGGNVPSNRHTWCFGTGNNQTVASKPLHTLPIDNVISLIRNELHKVQTTRHEQQKSHHKSVGAV